MIRTFLCVACPLSSSFIKIEVKMCFFTVCVQLSKFSCLPYSFLSNLVAAFCYIVSKRIYDMFTTTPGTNSALLASLTTLQYVYHYSKNEFRVTRKPDQITTREWHVLTQELLLGQTLESIVAATPLVCPLKTSGALVLTPTVALVSPKFLISFPTRAT